MPHAPRSPSGHIPGLRSSGQRRPRLHAASLALLLAGGACVPALAEPDDAAPEELAPEETRTVELRFLRLDAKNFEQVLTKQDILTKFPERVLRETWLLDMDLAPLIGNALGILIDTPADEAYTLPQSSLNMWKLLNMTPANTVLTGSSLAPLLGVGKAVGLAPSLILSDLVALDPNTNISSTHINMISALLRTIRPSSTTSSTPTRTPAGAAAPSTPPTPTASTRSPGRAACPSASTTSSPTSPT